MNKRIQELAEQAKTSVPPNLDVAEWITVYNQKLAELIVKECFVIMNEITSNHDSRGLFHAHDIIGQVIASTKKHLGVEID